MYKYIMLREEWTDERKDKKSVCDDCEWELAKWEDWRKGEKLWKKRLYLAKGDRKMLVKEDGAIKKADKRREICFSWSLYEREII